MKKITGISLFSGAGGMDIGFELAGIDVRFQNEIDKDALLTLQTNAKKNILINNSSVISLEKKDFKEVVNNSSGLVVFGGPPCQPFSKNGYWVTNDKRMKDNDPRNLIDEFFRVVSILKPDGFLLENVESILHPTNKEAVNRIYELSEKLGYRYSLYRADATRFGIPQKRKRIFVFGLRGKGDIHLPSPTHGTIDEIKNDTSLNPIPGVNKFIKKFNSNKFFEEAEVCQLGTYYKQLMKIPPGKNYLHLSSKDPKSTGHDFKTATRFWNFLLKLHPEEPSWTIPAQPGPWVGPFHWDNRRLRVPEIAAIQTFPESYKFMGSRRSIQKQIGNAVPAELSRIMASCLIKNL